MYPDLRMCRYCMCTCKQNKKIILIILQSSYNIIEDPRPHEVHHSGGLIDVHTVLLLQLVDQGGQGTKQTSTRPSRPAHQTS